MTIASVLSNSITLAATEGDVVFQPQASTFAPGVDFLFYAITWISLFFFVGIVGVMVYFVLRFQRRPGVAPAPSPHHNTLLEVTWSVIPAGILVYIFGAGFLGWLDMRSAPDGAYEIQVNAKSWAWSFTYPSGYSDDELHLSVDEPTKLIMQSDDVIHSLYIPAFRTKQDVVPGRITKMWFEPNRIGDYRLYCTEYCGQKHSLMTADVVVHAPGERDQWLEKATMRMLNMPPVELGALLYKKKGCVQCHSIDGNNAGKAGPSFKGSFGTTQAFADGSQHEIDENYIRESILEPLAKIRGGYKGVMPSYQGQLKDKEIMGLIAFIRSLGTDYDESKYPDAHETPELPKEDGDGEKSDSSQTDN